MASYPPTSGALRLKLARMVALPDNAPEWTRFVRDDMRMQPWLLPALQAAVRERVWEAEGDPAVALIRRVHKLGISMKLNSGIQPVVDPDEEPDEEEESE